MKTNISIPKNGLIEIINCDENGKVQFNTEIPFGKYYVQEYATDKHLDLIPVTTSKWTELENVQTYFRFFEKHRQEFIQ